ncbi:MAG: hypothetical protein U1F43_03245 [Myxococcota bacterium]
MRSASALLVSACFLACSDDPTAPTDVAADTSADASSDVGPDGDATDDGASSEGRALLDDGEALLWRALGGEVAVRADALATLESGLALLPDDPRGNLMYGMGLLSAVAEDGDIAAALDAIPVLQHAIAVAPDDLRIPGWLGTVKVPIARFTGDAAALTAACDDMIAAADAYPEFNNVSLAIAFSKLPFDTPYPQMAVDRMDAIQSCADTVAVCQNTARAPHNDEGALMLYGDVHARVGDKAQATAYYQAALASPTAATWKYRAQAQAILDDLDGRIARYLDADPQNDPAFFAEGSTSCVGCHAP